MEILKLWVLKKIVGHDGIKTNNSKMTWDDWRKKLDEESNELVVALYAKDKHAIMEEVMDVIQVCIGIIAKLFREGIAIEQGIHKHNKKLCNRGCEVSAEIKFNVIKK